MAYSTLRTVLDVTSTNSTNTGSGETSANLLNDRINLMAATTLLGFTYGIMTTLYCITTYSLLKKLFRRNAQSGSHPQLISRYRTERRKILFYVIYTSILFVLSTLYTAGNSQNAIVAYVDNRSYPGGPYQYFAMFMAGQGSMVMTDVTSLIILWMTDGLILVRFIMFYYNVAYARWIIPIPCAMYVGVIVSSTLVVQEEAGLRQIFYLSESFLLAYYALSFSLSVIATVLIAGRLYWHKIQLERVFGPGMESPYMSIATTLIESAAIYGAWSLVFLILCILQSPGQTIVLATMPQVQVIAPLLIILWVARGKAWGRSENLDEDEEEEEVPDKLCLSSVGRLSFGSRPAPVVGEFNVGDIHRSIGLDASWSTVDGAKHGDDNVHMIEPGLYGSEPPNVIDDMKV